MIDLPAPRPTGRLALSLLAAIALLAGCAALPPAPQPGVDTGPVALIPRPDPLPSGWEHGAFMEVFVRGYQDSDGDGIGDLRGLTQRLDYLQRLGGRARRFVSIAGPHQGSLTAYGLPGRLGRELRPGSALLRDLAGDWEATARQTPTTAIWTPFDLIVSPGWSGRLPGATAVRVPVRHGALLGHPRVQALALDLRA